MSYPDHKKTVSIGKITGLHGVRGYLKLRPWGDVEKKGWKRLLVYEGEIPRVLEVEKIRPHKTFLLIKIKGIDIKDEEVQKLVGSEVYVLWEDLEKTSEDEYYWFELIGLEVFTDGGRFLGLVKEIFPTGSNDVLIVEDDRELLIPATKEVIKYIDKEAGKIVITPYKGLVEEE